MSTAYGENENNIRVVEKYLDNSKNGSRARKSQRHSDRGEGKRRMFNLVNYQERSPQSNQ
jgi:hypothetical protein